MGCVPAREGYLNPGSCTFPSSQDWAGQPRQKTAEKLLQPLTPVTGLGAGGGPWVGPLTGVPGAAVLADLVILRVVSFHKFPAPPAWVFTESIVGELLAKKKGKGILGKIRLVGAQRGAVLRAF